MDRSTLSYPKRKAYFAHRYCRLLTKTCAAQEIGHIAFVLCVTIAHQEDAKRYSGSVSFFNEQLMPLVGVTKWESLDRARQRAAQAGWLHYEPGNRGQRTPGRYWVTVPEHLEAVDDKPCDESHYPRNGESVESQYPAEGDREGERRGDREGEHSTLTLNLSNGASDDASAHQTGTKRKRTTKPFIAPTLEEVQAYCQERKNQVDPQRFLDYYESNGWKVGRNSMKDWRAAVRTWERNGYSSSEGQVKQAEPVKYRG
jgi:hypothetical protein